MNKSKLIITLLTLTCALAATTASASAYFEAKVPGATKGPVAKLPETSTFEAGVGGVEVKCTRNAKATAFWNIQISEEQVITKGTKQQQQPGTKVGPHEAITITDWGTCLAFNQAAKVSPCRLQVAQSKGATTGVGSVQTDCVIVSEAAACTIIVDQQTENHKLETINLENTAVGVLIKANVSAITYKTVGAGCAVGGLPAEGHAAKFKTGIEGGEGIETALQKLI